MAFESAEFRKKFNKLRRILTQEVIDGCKEYLENKVLCKECADFIGGMVSNPRMYIDVKNGTNLKPMPQCSTVNGKDVSAEKYPGCRYEPI